MPPSASVRRPVTSATALAERRPQLREGLGRHEREGRQGPERQERHDRVDAQQEDERDDRRDRATHELHEPRADQVPDTLDVVHDARHELAGLRIVEHPNRELQHVGLHLGAEVRDEVLCLYAQQHGQGVGGRRLYRHRHRYEPQQLVEERGVPLGDHVVDQVLRGRRQHEAAQPVHEDEDEAERDELPTRPDDLLEGVTEARAGDLLGILHGNVDVLGVGGATRLPRFGSAGAAPFRRPWATLPARVG